MNKKIKALEAKLDEINRLYRSTEKKRNALTAKMDNLYVLFGNVEDKLEALKDMRDEAKMVDAGDIPSPAQAKLMHSQPFSYGVNFLRAKALKKVKSPGSVCVSTRYFATKKEAMHHGKRFAKMHGHKEFSIVVVSKKANAWVNWKTGKTNPAI